MKTKFNGILTLILVLLVQITFAQEKTISGTVSDESGPLPGVNVIIKGTKNGTQTDFDGKYSIKAKTGDVIVFSFVGMTTTEKTVGTASTINTILSADNLLEEIVVLGYTSRGKNELTGSTVQISGDDLAETPVTSVDQVLQGKVAGLSISSTSGTPGSVQNIRIRGVSSITSNNEPLYVIDGVPMINGDISGYSETSNLSSLASFNGNNIESVTVLKDASATSAYGARGSNGVIVITTKNGKAGKTQFNFGTSYGWSNNAVEGHKVLTASQWDELFTEAIGYSAWDGVTDTSWGDLISNDNAISQTYDLSARGGGDDYNFYSSIGYNSSEATVIGVDFERITGQLNLTKDFSDKIKYSTKNSFSTMTQNGFLDNSAYFSNPYLTKYFMPSYLPAYNDDGSYYLGDDLPLYNTLYVMENNIYQNVTTRLTTNNDLSWKILENLTFKTKFSADYIVSDYKQYGDKDYGDDADTGGYLYELNTQRFNWVTQNSLQYKFQIGNDHNLEFNLIQEYQKNKTNYVGAEGEGFVTGNLQTLDSAGTILDAYGAYTDWMIGSYLGLFNYSFSNKYYLDATYRREGSSRFPSANRWGNFWS
ncbi:SusC/RagA family TonB-linked outer membrane protein, partial [Lutibacter sp.]|uniref:SusC/RagA family TonB-linked outer membrane protein n=1 Tax=Lutibacter sp. TaxID=1925666 RepID=UPI003562172F